MTIGEIFIAARERQIHQQVLRLEAQPIALVHRHREPDGPAGDRRPHVGRIFEIEPEQAQQPMHPRIVDRLSIVKVVQDAARLGIEADVPAPVRVVDFPLDANGAFTPRKCAIHASITRNSAVRTRPPRLRLTEKS